MKAVLDVNVHEAKVVRGVDWKVSEDQAIPEQFDVSATLSDNVELRIPIIFHRSPIAACHHRLLPRVLRRDSPGLPSCSQGSLQSGEARRVSRTFFYQGKMLRMIRKTLLSGKYCCQGRFLEQCEIYCCFQMQGGVLDADSYHFDGKKFRSHRLTREHVNLGLKVVLLLVTSQAMRFA